MPERLFGMIGVFAALAAWAAAWGHAQTKEPPEKPAAESVPASPAGGVREVKPETFYLRDSDGNLVPVPNLPLEELDRLLKLELKLSQSGPTLPSFSLQELSITGTANQQQAELTVTLTVRTQSENWVRIPLRFADAVLREPPRHEGDGDLFLDYEKEGYVCWLRAPPDKVHTLSLRFTAPLREVGNELRLPLQVPRATSSQLDLRLPLPDAAATVNNGVLQVRHQPQETQLLVAGLAGDFQIAWRRADLKPASGGPLLEVRSETLVTIESGREVSADIRLRVSSLRGEFDAFRVRLPAGMRLFPRQFTQPGLQVTEVAGTDEAAGTNTVQVKLDRPLLGPVEVQLLTELAPLGEAKLPEFELTGLEVDDAVRQAGTLDFAVKGDWLVTWKPGTNVQRTAVPEALKSKVAARFEFARRSFALRMQVAPKETEVSVEPIYVLVIDATRVRLDAHLKYKIRGTGVYTVNVRLTGWRVSEVTPANLVDNPNLDLERLEPLAIPLAPAALGGTDEFILRVTGEQAIADPAKPVLVVLPRPEAKLVAPATVVVLPADNVELTVAESETQGLDRESNLPPIELPPRQQPPLLFRERGDAKTAVLAANLRTRTRSVLVNLTTTLHVEGTRHRVEQQFAYRIAYEPVKTLGLDVPRAVLDAGKLRILHGDQPLPFAEMPETAAQEPPNAPKALSVAEQPVRVQVDLLAEQIGAYELLLQYEVPVAAPPTDKETPRSVPGVWPAAEGPLVIASNSLRVHPVEVLQVRVAEGGWEPVDADTQSEGPTNGDLWFRAPELTPLPRLLVRAKESRGDGTTVVRQAWLQTWLGRSERRDRAVFRLTTNRPRLSVQLPEAAELQEVAVDGRRMAARFDDAGTLALVLPATAAEHEHVLELWYTCAAPGWSTGRVTLDVPRLADAYWINPWYWQLVLPSDQHLVSIPTGMTPEFTWQREGLFWVRESALSQTRLQQLTGAVSQAALPDALNVYWLSAFGGVDRVTFLTAPRWLLLLVGSGLVLFLGLLFLYVPLLRHPATLLVAGVGLVTAILAAPDLAPLAGQASGLGLLLLVVGGFLKWLVDWRQARRAVVRGTTYAAPDSKTMRAPPPAEPVSLPTTATAPLPAGESRP